MMKKTAGRFGAFCARKGVCPSAKVYFIDAMGSIIGTHAGPGVVATAYFKTGYER